MQVTLPAQPPKTALPLQSAVLCGDCDAVSNSVHLCVSCGSAALLSLARVLNRGEHDLSY